MRTIITATMSHPFLLSLVLLGSVRLGIRAWEQDCTVDHTDTNTIVTCYRYNVTEVPQWLPVNSTKMSMSGTGIKVVQMGNFSRYKQLTELFFRDLATDPCRLEYCQPGIFNGLDKLQVIGMVGCVSLDSIEKGVLGHFKQLKKIQIYRSGLTSVPDLSSLSAENADVDGLMEDIDFHNNRIEMIKTNEFSGIKVTKINLAQNKLRAIENYAFQDSTIAHILLSQNPLLTSVAENAFAGIKSLMELDLSETGIKSLPTVGLGQLKRLYLKETPQLKQFPSVLEFNHLEKVELYYPHHCCAFKNPEKQDPALWKKRQETQERINTECAKTTPSTLPSNPGILGTDMTPLDIPGFGPIHRNKRDFGAIPENGTFPGLGFSGDIIDTSNTINAHGHECKENCMEGKFHNGAVKDDINTTHRVKCGNIFVYNMNITCTPVPDAFNPCEDVMGYEWLRVTCWFVLLAALLGNFIVFTVLVTGRGKITVPKFLMCNLAFADFLMGVYLLILAAIDIHTLGKYFNFAVLWQNEGGCQVAGFLTVFSSELSIYTLTIITLERWYAIRHAIHLNKRIKLRHALVLMTLGYAIAIVLAVLPLCGISGYGNVSICLPMKVENQADKAYVVSLLILNGLLFLAICFCYVSMYWKVKGSDSTARSNDATIAKRMALLVFTNFACWAPIAFFGLTASAGAPLIDITHSKILLVFFYPLNSCANPFLYAILTKQFRKDVFIFLGKYGVCVEKANSYRGTYTSRSLSHSRGGKDVALHCIGHNNDAALFSQFMESNINVKNSGSGIPKVHPSISCNNGDISPNGRANGRTSVPSGSKSRWNHGTKSNGTERMCPPYIRSVSDYMALGQRRESAKKSAPKHQVSTETYISSSTDTTCISDVSHGTSDDIWRIREEDSSEEREMCGSPREKIFPDSSMMPSCNQSDRKMKPFTCDIYSTDDEMRISHENCYTTQRDSDLDEEEEFHRLLLHDADSNCSRDQHSLGCSTTSDNSFTCERRHKYKFARSPSLSSLTETPEQNVAPSSALESPLSHSCRSLNYTEHCDSGCQGDELIGHKHGEVKNQVTVTVQQIISIL